MSLASKDELRPSLIDRRWKDIKSKNYLFNHKIS